MSQSDTIKTPIDIYDDIKAGRVKLASKDEEQIQESSAVKYLNKYLAFLRVLTVVHQHSHWKCSGPNFYGNHLLFERIYDNTIVKVDAVAEKIIGLFGNNALNHKEQLPLMAEFCKYHSDDFIKNSLDAEKQFLIIAEDTYNRLKETGELSLGLDDLIMTQISDSETNCYLISQA